MATQSVSQTVQDNRASLREWFIDNPNGNIHVALNTALKEKRAAGLTKDIASALRVEALEELKVRTDAVKRASDEAKARDEAIRAKVQCARCKAVGHWASECTVVLEVVEVDDGPNDLGPPKFILAEEDHPDAPETQLKALQFVLLKLAAGALFTLSEAREAGANVGSAVSWRRAFEALLSKGLLEKATGKVFSAHLWGAPMGKLEELGALAANDLKLAGTLWQGSESEGLVLDPLDDVAAEVPATPPQPAPAWMPEAVVETPGAPVLVSAELLTRLDALFNLMEANLQVSQGILNLLMAQRGGRNGQ